MQQQNNKNILATQNLSVGYRCNKEKNLCLLSNLNLSIHEGEIICLLGPNGSGKSTLMRTIAGIQSPLSGNILIQGTSIKKLNFKEIARLLSIVLTEKLNLQNLTVYHIVSLGRHPYTSWIGRLSDNDKQKIEWALQQVGLVNHANKYINQLSDGEKQRVMIAKALSQDTPLIMLDEPTAHLDIPGRVEIIRLLGKLARETNKAILLSTHELDLALQAANRVWLISKGKPIKIGAPEDLVLKGNIEDTFYNKHFKFDHKTGSFIMNHQQKQKIQLIANGVTGFWTKRALAREGYQVTNSESQFCSITLDEKNMLWNIQQNGENISCKSIEDLLNNLRNIFDSIKTSVVKN